LGASRLRVSWCGPGAGLAGICVGLFPCLPIDLAVQDSRVLPGWG